MKKHPISLTVAAAFAGLVAIAPRGTATSTAKDDVFARTRAAYASLRSYADTGTVDEEIGSSAAPLRERHTFRTYYRAPRHFYFDFTKQENSDRFVVWSDDEAFHSWWQATGIAEVYPKGQGTAVFAIGGTPTLNALTQIAPLLFAQAGLTGTLTEFRDASAAGTEAVSGRPCYKLVGVARSVYGATGHVVNVRPTTVWVDVETALVRRVLEDAAEGTAAGTLNRFTTTFEPQANPTLDDTRFRFTTPAHK